MTRVFLLHPFSVLANQYNFIVKEWHEYNLRIIMFLLCTGMLLKNTTFLGLDASILAFSLCCTYTVWNYHWHNTNLSSFLYFSLLFCFLEICTLYTGPFLLLLFLISIVLTFTPLLKVEPSVCLAMKFTISHDCRRLWN